MKARVFILYTGGTIGMVHRERGNLASPLMPGSMQGIEDAIEDLIPPDQSGIECKVFGPLEGGALDSSDVNADHWVEMARVIADVYEDYDGFVILHGTDTMAYTASGLSFIFRDLAKPVVITGSQLPLGHPRTDARLNLVNSVYVAGHPATGLPVVPEVVLCFGESLLRGNRARKETTSDLKGFGSPNYPVLGELGEHMSIDRRLLLELPGRGTPLRLQETWMQDVVMADIFPGITPKVLRQILAPDSETPRAIILKTYGAGNIPSRERYPELFAVICDALASGKKIINVTQCRRGMVEQGLYEASAHLAEVGVISTADITPEAALAKAFFVGGQHRGEAFAQQMLLNLRGEQSVSHHYLNLRREKTGAAAVHHVQGTQPVLRDKEDLFRSVLRVGELSTDDEVELRVFFNNPNAGLETPVDAPSFLCRAIPNKFRSVSVDITRQWGRLFEPRGALTLTLMRVDGAEFDFEAAQVIVLERAVSL